MLPVIVQGTVHPPYLSETGGNQGQPGIVHQEEATTLIRTPAGFDHDGYKILCKPLLSGNYEITELDPANDQRAS